MALHVGWMTTWNVKCGIASHVARLLDDVPAKDVVILASREESTLGPDQPNCIRCWTASKESNGLDAAMQEIERRSIGCLVIQYNYGFFNHFELRGFIESLILRGVAVMIDLHSTVDPKNLPNFHISEFAEALKKCFRVLAHGPADMNRLKALGVVDNVVMFPPGVVRPCQDLVAYRPMNSPPLVASFGFAFANKGLLELVEAAAILKNHGTPVKLRMLNALHDNPESPVVVAKIKSLIETHSLQEEVEFRSEFLQDDVCLRLLSEADLVVNPYQSTAESASGAVRYGIAAGRPVAVTPLAIFDDLGDSVFRLPGKTPADIAKGIADVLKNLKVQSPESKRVQLRARRWLDAHDFARQGLLLMQMFKALLRRQEQAFRGTPSAKIQ